MDAQKKEFDQKSLLQLARMYKIGGISIVDFIFVYIILYILNSFWLNLNYKFILLVTIPITIVFDLLVNDDFSLGLATSAVLIVSIVYLFLMDKYN